MLNENFTWSYNEESRRYTVRNARLLFVNFEGAAQDYNAEGRRNFRLEVSDDLAREMEQQGVYVRTRPGRDEDEGDQHLLKVSVYQDAEIRFIDGRKASKVTIDNNDPNKDMGALIDSEFRKGHVLNGKINLEFHISKNTRVPTSSPYLRVDTLILPIQRSQLLEEYEQGSFGGGYVDDEEDAF